MIRGEVLDFTNKDDNLASESAGDIQEKDGAKKEKVVKKVEDDKAKAD